MVKVGCRQGIVQRLRRSALEASIPTLRVGLNCDAPPALKGKEKQAGSGSARLKSAHGVYEAAAVGDSARGDYL